jgi:hypothetical protein
VKEEKLKSEKLKAEIRNGFCRAAAGAGGNQSDDVEGVRVEPAVAFQNQGKRGEGRGERAELRSSVIGRRASGWVESTCRRGNRVIQARSAIFKPVLQRVCKRVEAVWQMADGRWQIGQTGEGAWA